jgi:hypothetical protein
MWAHYADSHRGVCFVFRQTYTAKTFFAFDVSYEKNRPRIDFSKLDDQVFRQCLLTKGTDWEYEHERRMLDYRKPPGQRTFPPDSLVGIILGARISQEDRQFIDELVKRRRTPVEKYTASIDEAEFRLVIEQDQISA